jgi:hypothetical protein
MYEKTKAPSHLMYRAPTLPPNGMGRPKTQLSYAIEMLEVGEMLRVPHGGSPSTHRVRNLATHVQNRTGRKYRVVADGNDALVVALT